MKLYSLGATGTGTPTLADTFTTSNLSNAAIASAASLYSGVYGRSRDGLGVQVIDNLSVTGSGPIAGSSAASLTSAPNVAVMPLAFSTTPGGKPGGSPTRVFSSIFVTEEEWL